MKRSRTAPPTWRDYNAPVTLVLLGSYSGMITPGNLAHVAFTANIENCMVAQGWEVVRLDEAEGAALAAKSAADQAAALSSWVGAVTRTDR